MQVTLLVWVSRNLVASGTVVSLLSVGSALRQKKQLNIEYITNHNRTNWQQSDRWDVRSVCCKSKENINDRRRWIAREYFGGTWCDWLPGLFTVRHMKIRASGTVAMVNGCDNQWMKTSIRLLRYKEKHTFKITEKCFNVCLLLMWVLTVKTRHFCQNELLNQRCPSRMRSRLKKCCLYDVSEEYGS